MEIKNTVTVGDNDPIEVKVDVPMEGAMERKERPDVGEHARIFDYTCHGWSKYAYKNKLFLLYQQNYANNLLKLRGYLFLNEVYDMLGMSRTNAGQRVGWVYDPENPVGDNYVDFGIFDDRNVDFVNESKTSVLLEFNVDGDILKYL